MRPDETGTNHEIKANTHDPPPLKDVRLSLWDTNAMLRNELIRHGGMVGRLRGTVQAAIDIIRQYAPHNIGVIGVIEIMELTLKETEQ